MNRSASEEMQIDPGCELVLPHLGRQEFRHPIARSDSEQQLLDQTSEQKDSI
jgi:hypothetical protein